tara:strand:- start:468 stop:578 length:111 start_codon:yes stop_codon:yes gene_type:complete
MIENILTLIVVLLLGVCIGVSVLVAVFYIGWEKDKD